VRTLFRDHGILKEEVQLGNGNVLKKWLRENGHENLINTPPGQWPAEVQEEYKKWRRIQLRPTIAKQEIYATETCDKIVAELREFVLKKKLYAFLAPGAIDLLLGAMHDCRQEIKQNMPK
jgi:hypothetical protein